MSVPEDRQDSFRLASGKRDPEKAAVVIVIVLNLIGPAQIGVIRPEFLDPRSVVSEFGEG
jgi:hypothetical protein